ncbi:hypothetical protein GCM10027052_25290 [Parafrigoribacterium mesophilum]|uniref:hypothetical protein n=1 Tax=Parafrigoribacterium mesophilum TaxID=433646 RepID=UPI0031FD6087
MPPKLSARQLFWTGVVVTAVGVFVGQFLVTIVFSLWGERAINSTLLPSILQPLDALLVPLGALLLATSLIARTIEAQTRASHLHASARRIMPPQLTSRSILWTGIVLVVLGLILIASIGDFFMQLSGSTDVAANLARDLLGLVGVPLQTIAVPLGIALLPTALIVRMLEVRVPDHDMPRESELSRH